MNTTLKDEFKLTNDDDNWGNVMTWLFAISDLLMIHASKLFPQALKEAFEEGERARKERERNKRKERARAKQLTLNLK